LLAEDSLAAETIRSLDLADDTTVPIACCRSDEARGSCEISMAFPEARNLAGSDRDPAREASVSGTPFSRSDD